MLIEIGVIVGGKKSSIILEAETRNDYLVCKELLRKLVQNGVVDDYIIALVRREA